MIATPKAVYLRPFLEMWLVGELLTVPKRVMVFWVCMVFLLFARSIGTHPKGRGGVCYGTQFQMRLFEEEWQIWRMRVRRVLMKDRIRLMRVRVSE